MSVLRPLDKLPFLNTASVLMVSTEDALLQQLANAMLREECSSKLKIHLTNSLPLPSDVNRPRIDLVVFLINLQSKFSLQSVTASLQYLDATFFLGKVLFLATGAQREERCCTHRSTVEKLARTFRSPLLFCEVETEPSRAALALRLVRLLQMCAGHVPGVSSLDVLGLLRRPKNPENPAPDEL